MKFMLINYSTRNLLQHLSDVFYKMFRNTKDQYDRTYDHIIKEQNLLPFLRGSLLCIMLAGLANKSGSVPE